MTLPASGAISFSAVNIELGLTSTAQISLNDAAVRTLFGDASGAVAMADAYGKSNTSVPGAPTSVSASASSSSAISVSFSAPSCTGHLSIDYYQVVCMSSGSNSATGSSSPISVTGLSASTSYTFKVRAHNSKGYGCYSSSTGTATTQAVTGQAVYTTYGCYTFTPPAGVSKVSSLIISPSGWTYGPSFNPCYYWITCGQPGTAASAGWTLYSNNKSLTSFYQPGVTLTPTNTSFGIQIGNSNEMTRIRKSFSNVCSGNPRNLLYAYAGCGGGVGGLHWLDQWNNTGCAFIARGGYAGNPYRCDPNRANHKSLGGGGATGAGHGCAPRLTDIRCGYISYSQCNTRGPSRGGGYASSGFSGSCGAGGFCGGAGGGGGGSGTGGGGGGGVGLYGGTNSGAAGGVGAGGGGGSGGCSGAGASGINGGRGGTYGGGAGGGLNCYYCGSNYRFGVGGNPCNNSNPHYGAIRIVWPGCSRKFPSTCVGNY
jgi:hypothetical protein